MLSWPFQIAFAFLGQQFRPLLLVSMVMVMVATYIAGKFVFKDGFANAGWSWGKPKNYLMAFGLALFLWALPSLVEVLTGRNTPANLSVTGILPLFLFSFFVTLIPAFGEEFGWRGYMLPRLKERYTTRKALLLHGFITWFWHLPFLLVIGTQSGGNLLISIPAVLFISLIPTIMHAIVFAYFWSSSGSITVATVYHSAFDEVRDTLEEQVGFGSLVQPWQMISLTILGGVILWKANWKNTEKKTRK